MSAAYLMLRQESRRLDAFLVADARTPDEAQHQVARVLSPHHLFVTGRRRIAAQLHKTSVGPQSVLRLRYGTDVTIAPQPIAGHVLFQVVLAGTMSLDGPAGSITAAAGDALIIDSLAGTRLQWSEDCEQLIVPVSRSLLTAAAEKMGHQVSSGLGFERKFSLDAPAARATVHLLLHMLSQASHTRFNWEMARLAQQLFAAQLVASHSAFGPGPAVPGIVRRAERYISEHAEDRICLADIAAAAGGSVRSLCGAFRAFRNASPMAVVHAIRLAAARQALKDGQERSVTSAAWRFRFSNAGRFAQSYRARFGELPSQTLTSLSGSPLEGAADCGRE